MAGDAVGCRVRASEAYRLYRRRVLPVAGPGIRVADPSMRLHVERILTCFGDLAGQRILDYGAGSGHKAFLLALLGARVSAVEVAEAAVATMRQARELSGIDIEVVPGGAEALRAFQDASFGRILCMEVIEHLPEAELPSFRDELARILAPGGKLFLSTPNRLAVGPAEESPSFHQRVPFGHHRHYEAEELRRVFGPPAWKIIQLWFECQPLTLLRNRVFYRLAHYDAAIRERHGWSALRPFSWLFRLGVALAYPLAYRLQRRYEFRRAQRPTGATILLDLERVG
jgi:SAM-dependent methyltransferase